MQKIRHKPLIASNPQELPHPLFGFGLRLLMAPVEVQITYVHLPNCTLFWVCCVSSKFQQSQDSLSDAECVDRVKESVCDPLKCVWGSEQTKWKDDKLV